ncbi:hypothetical protein [Natrononativus amylolyticus]|uniref:hypothetical protein n=1 Tax=Natrononativus amylolyticus TaxID=2963434 RepID=UPI0020CE2B80|nr:hypothetical protein [Natrononativus amylolyticus]
MFSNSHADQSDGPDRTAHVEQLQKRVDHQEATIERLEATLTAEQRRRRQLERRLAALDRDVQSQPTVEIRGKHFIENIWIDGLPIGNGVQMRAQEIEALEADLLAIEDRVHDIEVGEIDPGELIAESGGTDLEELLPIHQKYLTVQHVPREQHRLYARQELAARLFPHFEQYAHTNEGRMVLTSNDVRKIIDREIYSPELAKHLDVDSPNNNTIRESMKWIGTFGADLLEFNDEPKQNRIVADRDDWLAYTRRVTANALMVPEETAEPTDLETEPTAPSLRGDSEVRFDGTPDDESSR